MLSTLTQIQTQNQQCNMFLHLQNRALYVMHWYEGETDGWIYTTEAYHQPLPHAHPIHTRGWEDYPW